MFNVVPKEENQLDLSGKLERFKRFIPGGRASGLVIILGLAFLGFFIWTSLYTIPSDSVAVVQRFGKYLKEVPPFHLACISNYRWVLIWPLLSPSSDN